MTVRERVLEINKKLEPLNKEVAALETQKDRILDPFAGRIYRYLIAKKEIREDQNLQVVEGGISGDTDSTSVAVERRYDEDYWDTYDVPWWVLEFSDEKFDAWEHEETHAEKLAEEERAKRILAYSKEQRRKQYEELRKEFE